MKLFNYERHLKRFHAGDTQIDIPSLNLSNQSLSIKDSKLSCEDLTSNQFYPISIFRDTEISEKEKFQNDVLQYCCET